MASTHTNYTQGYTKANVESHATRTATKSAAFLLPHLRPTDRVLDLGCGPGSITIGLASHVPDGSVVGVDLSEEVLKRAIALADQPANLSFQPGDILAGLAFPDDSFDVVFSSQMFLHLGTDDNRRRALAEARRVLKPGGLLATSDAADFHHYPRHYNLDRLWARNVARAIRPDDPEDQAVAPGGDMPALVRQAGFGRDGRRMEVDAATTVHWGSESRRFFSRQSIARLEKGNPTYDSMRKVGISDAEIEEAKEAFRKFADDEDAWFVGISAEVLAWK